VGTKLGTAGKWHTPQSTIVGRGIGLPLVPDAGVVLRRVKQQRRQCSPRILTPTAGGTAYFVTTAARMEAAADRALLTGACRYQSVKSILKNSLDQQPLSASPSLPPPPAHDNIRGAEYFE